MSDTVPRFDATILSETIRMFLQDPRDPMALQLLAFNLGYFDARHDFERSLSVPNEHYRNAREAFRNYA